MDIKVTADNEIVIFDHKPRHKISKVRDEVLIEFGGAVDHCTQKRWRQVEFKKLQFKAIKAVVKDLATVKGRLEDGDNVTEHDGSCSYQAILDYLNLTTNKELFTMSRPVKHFKKVTKVHFAMLISSILDVIHVKRRSVLYIANFLVPVLFFFCLDLSSFLISDSGGEKLSFKVTVMLAVTVMQLILNEILPSSSDRIPLIALFCIGIFGLMMLSLLETIFVMYLMEKDAASQNNETNSDLSLNRSKQSCFKVKKCGNCASISDVSTNQTPNTKEDSSSQLMEVSFTLEKVSEELQQIENT
ncbi:acetylcholine receptor subunit beta-type acr-3-like, partial [Salarias fasciatus]|uniref:acetylcholine receptor subunit beta-type acr-3-like n=1 Tax=Salarias fasciatus TaxID=181472 RepID=UPI001176CBF9